MFGSFTSELEMYQFFDWLEFYVAPRKNVEPKEAHEKARFYTFSLRLGQGSDTALQLLTAFRQSKTKVSLTAQS